MKQKIIIDVFPTVFQLDNKHVKIIDLYTPGYLPCISDACLKCKTNEKCLFEPFKSSGHALCFCKAGYAKINESAKCLKNETMAGQLTGEMNLTIPIAPAKMVFSRFRFRTLHSNGNLIMLSVDPYIISIKISNKLIHSLIYNQIINRTKIIPINYYNVADGEWHTINMELTKFRFKVTLDEKIPFNSNSTLFDHDFVNNKDNNFVLSSITFGAMININSRNSNLSTCFDTFTFFDDGSSMNVFNINLKGVMSEGCEKGINCTSLICTDHRKCVEKWQNSSCVCEDAFTDFSETCLFTKCISNPCKNGGICSYNGETKDYQCRCSSQYKGRDCEISIIAAKLDWWIILIIVLLLIIILIIVLLFLLCRKKRPKRRYEADINAIYENTVSYDNKAGESDYEGNPINFEILKKFTEPQIPDLEEIPENIKEDLMARKQFYDSNNNDLIIDHPLTYNFEGYDSDLESVSSMDSYSIREPVNILPLPRKSSNLRYLDNLNK